MKEALLFLARSILKKKKPAPKKAIVDDVKGIVFEFSDKRKGIVFNDQPKKGQGQIIIHVVDDNIQIKKNQLGQPITILRRINHEYLKSAKTIGFVKSK